MDPGASKGAATDATKGEATGDCYKGVATAATRAATDATTGDAAETTFRSRHESALGPRITSRRSKRRPPVLAPLVQPAVGQLQR